MPNVLTNNQLRLLRLAEAGIPWSADYRSLSYDGDVDLLVRLQFIEPRSECFALTTLGTADVDQIDR
jgi:hypothetical protein